MLPENSARMICNTFDVGEKDLFVSSFQSSFRNMLIIYILVTLTHLYDHLHTSDGITILKKNKKYLTCFNSSLILLSLQFRKYSSICILDFWLAYSNTEASNASRSLLVLLSLEGKVRWSEAVQLTEPHLRVDCLGLIINWL